jgi:hypothetical protein
VTIPRPSQPKFAAFCRSPAWLLHGEFRSSFAVETPTSELLLTPVLTRAGLLKGKGKQGGVLLITDNARNNPHAVVLTGRGE